MRQAFERFCRLYDDKGIKNLAILVILVKTIMFSFNIVLGNGLFTALYYSPAHILSGQWWRLLSFILLPSTSGSIVFFLFEILFLYWAGIALERNMGRMKFTIYYFTGIFLSIFFAVFHFILFTLTGGASYIGASTFISSYPLNVSLLLAFATMFPDMELRIMLILPVKAKWLGYISFVLLLYPILPPPHNLLKFYPLVAIGNFFIFFAPDFIKTYTRRRSSKVHRAKTINFAKAAKEKRREQGYIHKCAVCGATDTDGSGKEFRYCSLCSGYQCYCNEHIFNHEHR